MNTDGSTNKGRGEIANLTGLFHKKRKTQVRSVKCTVAARTPSAIGSEGARENGATTPWTAIAPLEMLGRFHKGTYSHSSRVRARFLSVDNNGKSKGLAKAEGWNTRAVVYSPSSNEHAPSGSVTINQFMRS